MSRRRVLPIVIVALGVGGFFKWNHNHSNRVTGDGNPASFRCYQCHGPLAHRAPVRPIGSPYASPVALTLSPDGSRLFASCEGTDEIVVMDTIARRITARWPAGDAPHGLACSGDALYVAQTGEDRVAILDAGTGEETGSVPVGAMPCGLALDPAGATLVVANSASNDLSLIDTATRREVSRLAAGREPFAVSVTADGSTAWILNRMATPASFPHVPTSEVTRVDLASRSVASRPGAFSAHLGEGIAAAGFDGGALVSLLHVRNLVPITQVAQGWVMTSTLGFARPGDDDVLQFPLDEVNDFFADPSGVAVDRDHHRAYVASGGTNRISVVDLDRLRELARDAHGEHGGPWSDHLGISSEYVLARIPVAANPRALLLSPDGDLLYVAERLGASVAVIDTETLEVAHRFTLDAAEPDLIRRGEILFHDAAVTFQNQFSCRSCHPGGQADGLAYDFAIDGVGRNILDNRSLLGLAGTAPFKWNGKNRSLFDQCGPRFARVLTRSDPFPPVALDELVNYILSLPPPRPEVPAGDAEAAAIARGRVIFERTHRNDGTEIPKEMRCNVCHRPPIYTSRRKMAVGVDANTDTVRDFDVPHLLGVSMSPPYLHDGRALTLEEIWTKYDKAGQHGVVNDLTKEQLNDLVEFLKSI